jgi:hypothetical protein
MPSDLLEALAAQEHEQWAGWAKYLLQDVKGTVARGVVSIMQPWATVDRWRKQASTPYADLSEEDKEKDRVFARMPLAAIAARGMFRTSRAADDAGMIEVCMREDDYDAIIAAWHGREE